jgi:hypothetical protein
LSQRRDNIRSHALLRIAELQPCTDGKVGRLES